MKRLPEKLERVLELLESMDPAERIQMLVDLAGTFRSVPPSVAKKPYPPERRVPGCESEAYVWAQPGDEGNLDYYFAVENPQGISAMALAAILADSLSSAPSEDVATIQPDVVFRIFGRELSMGKSLGLMGLVNMVRAEANRHLRKAVNSS